MRQVGNLSFSRVFQAGHEVPYYQPETAFRIFQRAVSGVDIATGQISTTGSDLSSSNSSAGQIYSTTGTSNAFDIKDTAPPQPVPTCYLWDMIETCLPSEKAAVLAGTAIVKDFIYMGMDNQTQSGGGNGSVGGGAGPSGGSVATGKGWKTGVSAGWMAMVGVAGAYLGGLL